MSARDLYQHRKVAFLTQHGKQTLLKSAFESALGCEILHTDAYDTDLLGTFTRDQIRPGSQLDARSAWIRLGALSLGTQNWWCG